MIEEELFTLTDRLMLDEDDEKTGRKAITNPELTRLYNFFKNEYKLLVQRAITISRGSGGVFVVEKKIYWAAILFTRLVVTSQSILKILPDTKPGEHWDFSAVASLSRNLTEAYLFYFWLCEDKVMEVVAEARFIILNLHDHGTRGKVWGTERPAPDVAYEDLEMKFYANAYLKNLPQKKQRELLRGEKTPFIQDELLQRMGVDAAQFRKTYRFFSEHTHTGPMSFYRMVEHDRGMGVETRQEKRYMILAMGMAVETLNRAIAGHLKIFPDAETRSPYLTDKEVRFNVETAQGRK